MFRQDKTYVPSNKDVDLKEFTDYLTRRLEDLGYSTEVSYSTSFLLIQKENILEVSAKKEEEEILISLNDTFFLFHPTQRIKISRPATSIMEYSDLIDIVSEALKHSVIDKSKLKAIIKKQ